jgi:acyl dehydratase
MFAESTLHFEDLEVGQTYLSQGRTITEADVVNFAGISWDFNVLHTDEEFMKKTQFGKRIAHGLLGLAIQSGLTYRALSQPVATLAFLGLKEWNFKGPIYMGDTIRLRLTIAEKRETSKPDRGVVSWRRELLNQSDEVVQEGLTLTLVRRRG